MNEPTSIDYYNQALDSLEAGNAPEALASIVNALTEDPADAESWKLYIVVLNAVGRHEDATKAMAKLAGLGVSESDQLAMQAATAAARGDFDGSIAIYRQALAADPDRAELHAGLALTRQSMGQPEAALADAERAVALEPGHPRAQYALGHVLRLAERKPEALAALSEAVRLDPDFMLAVYEEGMLLADEGRLEEALANFEKFLVVHPRDPGATQAVDGLRQRLDAR